jgi:molecular chaperone DnaK (HSP70)
LDVYLAAQQMTKEKLAGQGHYDKQGDYENRNIFLYPAPLFGDVPWGFQRWGLASMTALSTEVLAERIDPRDRRESFEERLQRERTAEIKAAQQRIRESTGRSPEEMRRGREEWEAREEADRKRREEEVQRDRMRTAIYNTQHMHDK